MVAVHNTLTPDTEYRVRITARVAADVLPQSYEVVVHKNGRGISFAMQSTLGDCRVLGRALQALFEHVASGALNYTPISPTSDVAFAIGGTMYSAFPSDFYAAMQTALVDRLRSAKYVRYSKL